MSLTRVTITGADNGVKPADLLRLSEEFPFVEWGILVSPSREGTSRYPHGGWRNDFWDEFYEPVSHGGAQAALHLCGGAARETMDGDFSLLSHYGEVFRRVQLNGFAACKSMGLATVFRLALGHHRNEIILQAPDVETLVTAANLAGHARTWPIDDGVRNVSALFDPSGGRGLTPERWPLGPTGLSCGYAGGITPDNVSSTIGALLKEMIQTFRSDDFWIDMESGVRTNEAFDLDKVRRILELAAPFVLAPQRATP